MTTVPVTLDFVAFTANIQNLKDLSRVDTRAAIAPLVGVADIGGFQETIELEDNDDIESQLPSENWWHAQRLTECDLAVRRSKFSPCPEDRLPSGFTQNNGKVKLTDGVPDLEPTRYLTWAILIWNDDPTLDPFLLADVHLVPGVDSHNPDRPEIRKEHRNQQRNGMAAFFDKAHKVKLPILWVGDTNWVKMPKFYSWEQLFADNTIDKIRFIGHGDANWTLSMASLLPVRVDTPSDHDVFMAQLTRHSMKDVPLPKPPKPAVVVLTEAWLAKYNINPTTAAAQELLAIVAGTHE